MNTGQIKFTNTGQALLKITEVGRCCGVVAKLDKDKTEYAPGESGAVKIEWRSGSQRSVFKRQLVVHSNDAASPTTNLAIQAKVVLKVTWEPKRLRLYLDKENAGGPKVTISSLDNQPFSIGGFKSTGDCMTADFDPSAKVTKHVIEPKVKMEKLQKNLKGRININLMTSAKALKNLGVLFVLFFNISMIITCPYFPDSVPQAWSCSVPFSCIRSTVCQ